MKKTVLILAALLLSQPLLARTVYVSDKFFAPLRTGQTNAYRIVANLQSGTALELLESNEESGYSRVRTRSGTEGWMLTRYLDNQPVARTLLDQAREQLNALQEKNSTLSNNHAAAQDNLAELTQQNEALQSANARLEEELSYIKEVSGNTLSINQRNQQLIEENQQLKNRIDLLSSDNERLKDDANNQFFMLGAGAILLGLVLGLVLPALKPKRKDTGWI